MKILHIGQLPTNAGGNYSTGMGKVVYELSNCNYNLDDIFIYATNANEKLLKSPTSSKCKYLGYRYNLISFFVFYFKNFIKLSRLVKKIHRFSSYNIFRGLFYTYNFNRVIRIISPDVIHIHSIDYALPLSTLREIYKIPVLLTCHGVFNIEELKRQNLYIESLRDVDYVSVLTDNLKKVIANLGFPAEKIKIISNGVNTSTFYYSEDERKKLRKELNVSDNTTLFITVGSIQKRKGQLAFLKDLMNSRIDFTYWIIGDGSDKEKIISFVNDFNLHDRVKLLGYIDTNQLYKYYSASDIYAHVSEQEGQALSEIEAYTTGLKVIVNKHIEQTIVNPEKDHKLYFVDTVGHINWEKCQQWIAEPQNRTTRPNFDWQTIANQYVETYYNIKRLCHI